MAKKDPYKDSPYDASGMPLGAETVDYDNQAEVAQHTVKDKYVEQPSIADVPFDESVTQAKWQKRTKFNPVLNNTAIQTPGHKVYKKHEDDLGEGLPESDPDQRDLDNPEEVEKLAKEDAKETNKSKVKSDKVVHDKDDEDDDFLKALKDV
jgi:hypothetical protein